MTIKVKDAKVIQKALERLQYALERELLYSRPPSGVVLDGQNLVVEPPHATGFLQSSIFSRSVKP